MSLISSWYLLFRQKFRSIYRFKWQLTDFTFKEKLSSNINNVFCAERKCHKWEVFLLQMTNVPFCPIEKKQSLVKTIRYTTFMIPMRDWLRCHSVAVSVMWTNAYSKSCFFTWASVFCSTFFAVRDLFLIPLRHRWLMHKKPSLVCFLSHCENLIQKR